MRFGRRRSAFVVLVALGAIAAPPAGANPDSAADLAALKAADASVRSIVKTAGKAIAAAASRATARLGSLTSAVRTGKHIEDLTGVASVEGVKVSPQQRSAVVEEATTSCADFYDDAIGVCEAAYEAYAGSSALTTLSTTDTPRRHPGAGGPPDRFDAGLVTAWEKSSAAVDLKMQSLAGTLGQSGLTMTYVSGPPPVFVVPRALSAPTGVLQTPTIFASIGDSNGQRRALVGYAPAGNYTPFNAGVILFDGSNSQGMTRVRDFDDLGYFRNATTSTQPRLALIYLHDSSSSFTPVRPTAPVRVTYPGPCPPPTSGDALTSSSNAVHLGPVNAGVEATMVPITLTNTTSSPIAVSVAFSGSAASKFFASSPNFTVPANSTFVLRIGGSSTTTGSFFSTLILQYPGNSLDIPADLTVQ
jgi:hypothetical protein